MRFVVYGAGAIGGVVGGLLAEHGSDVVFIARGEHGAAIESAGLTIETPDDRIPVRTELVSHPSELAFDVDDVVLLAMKSQDTLAAVDALALAAPASIPVVCLQNGVENERFALRRFENVYGVCVMCPTGHLEPGVVQAFSWPTAGIVDLGRFPKGTDALAQTLAATFERSCFSSIARPDIMRWKYSKLLSNLGNALEAACGPAARSGRIAQMLVGEGVACLRAAGIDFASEAEDAERRGDLLRLRPVGGERRGGGSTWQSLARGTGSVESDYLNGEIVLLGRQHDVPTPANALLQRVATEMAANHAPAGSMTEAELFARFAEHAAGAVDG